MSDTASSESAPKCGPPAGKPGRSRLEICKDIAGTFQSALTVLAVMVGAYWYFLERGHVVKANVSHTVERVEIGNGLAWVQLTAAIENKSKHQITILASKAWLQQIVPLAPNMRALVGEIEQAKLSPQLLIKQDTGRVDWPAVGALIEVKNVRIIVEPGETERAIFEFIIPAEAKVLRAYTFLQPDLEKTTGWANISIHRTEMASPTTAKRSE